ncbi:MAG: galactokinase [Clostridia bacterium]|nr:galactokinase [Clostridia bacterium]
MSRGNLNKTLSELYGEENLADQIARYLFAVSRYEQIYGKGNNLRLFSVPGRTEISGNHTDHNHGKVLAASINLDIIAVAEKRDDSVIRIKSEGFPEDVVDITKIKVDPDKFATSFAVIEGMCDGFTKAGYTVGGFNAFTTSNVFKGSGLSSSAAFEVMVGNMLRSLYDNDIDNVEIAKISQYSENVFFGKPCGLMDQMACAIGGFISIDFADPKNPIVGRPDFDLSAMGYSLCILDTGGNHADLTPDYAAVPAEMKSVAAKFGKEVLRDVNKEDFVEKIPELREELGDRAILRALHFFNENERVGKLEKALEEKDITRFFEGIRASGNSSFKYLQNVYTTRNVSEQGLSLALELIEEFLSNVSEPSACRVHGGGFAGTVQAFVPAQYANELAEKLDKVFGKGKCHILRIRSKGAIEIPLN